MQCEVSAPAHTRRPRRQADRHAINAFGHVLVIGVWLECRLTSSLRADCRFRGQGMQRLPVVNQIQTNSTSNTTGEDR
jgi:hypothetical protein